MVILIINVIAGKLLKCDNSAKHLHKQYIHEHTSETYYSIYDKWTLQQQQQQETTIQIVNPLKVTYIV